MQQNKSARVLTRIAMILLAVLISLALGVVVALALFTNGGFEAGDFSGWTQTHFLNYGLSGSAPFDGDDINRDPGGVFRSIVTDTVGCDPYTNDNVCYPLFGSYSARVNGPGNNRNANTLVQTSTVTAGDVNPWDGKIHVMFAYAPVLENPSHEDYEQPWFYVALTNVTKDVLLYEEFIFSNQPGVPWKTGTGDWLYTDWQIKDIVPDSADIDIGDDVRLEVIASDCSLGAHGGWAWVDEFGSSIPGPFVSKRAAATVVPDTDLVYEFYYRNGSAETITSTEVVEHIPAQTVFSSADHPGCAHDSGVVTCTLGTLNAGVTGTFQITVHVDSGATGTIANGNYYIQAHGYNPLLGSLVNTVVVGADLAISKSYVMDYVSVITYTIVARNLGTEDADGAVVADVVPIQVTDPIWTCSSSGGATCTVSGSGDISDTLTSFPAGGMVTYTLSGATNASFFYLENTAIVTAPGGIPDPDLSNNSATAYRYTILLILAPHQYSGY